MNQCRIIEQGHLRPPSEARSLFVRVARNCPWNRCSFCPAFKGEKFSLRPLEEVLEDIRQMALIPKNHLANSVFLQDADALITPTRNLIPILKLIKELFPKIERSTAYARSTTLANKSLDELKALKEAGLDRIHVGFESGCDEVLNFVEKGVTGAKQKEACLKVKGAGLELCCYVMPGLGGKKFSEKHAKDTGKLLAQIAPHHIRLRTSFVLEDTPLADEYLKGHFEPLNDEEIIKEIRVFLTQLKETPTELVSDHRINLLLELRGKIPQDYEKLLGIIDRFLNLPPPEKELFIIGRRLNLIRYLDELQDETKRELIKSQAHLYKIIIPVPRSILY